MEGMPPLHCVCVVGAVPRTRVDACVGGSGRGGPRCAVPSRTPARLPAASRMRWQPGCRPRPTPRNNTDVPNTVTSWAPNLQYKTTRTWSVFFSVTRKQNLNALNRERFLSPRKHRAVSGDTFGCHSWRKGCRRPLGDAAAPRTPPPQRAARPKVSGALALRNLV